MLTKKALCKIYLTGIPGEQCLGVSLLDVREWKRDIHGEPLPLSSKSTVAWAGYVTFLNIFVNAIWPFSHPLTFNFPWSLGYIRKLAFICPWIQTMDVSI